VRKSLEELKPFTQRRKVEKDTEKTKRLPFASLRALASLRETIYSFIASPLFRTNSPLFILFAGRKAQPFGWRRERLVSTPAYGKAKPFRTAGGEAARPGPQVRT
jgi:hypothetical protein